MILNLTQHPASQEQASAGVQDLPGGLAAWLRRLLTFEEIPSALDLERRAASVTAIAAKQEARAAMIGGAPFFMAPLQAALRERGIKPLFAFSRRESREETLPDGSTKKVAMFRHLGFVDG